MSNETKYILKGQRSPFKYVYARLHPMPFGLHRAVTIHAHKATTLNEAEANEWADYYKTNVPGEWELELLDTTAETSGNLIAAS